MVEGAGQGGNTGGSGNPSGWLVADNEIGDSWNQAIKLDGVDDFTIARNRFVGSSDHVIEVTAASSGVKFMDDNQVGSGYGSIGMPVTKGTTPTPAPSGPTIMVIRHGEKPSGSTKGYTAPTGGKEDSHSLTLQGWARAAAFVSVFKTALRPGLSTPSVIYAADGPVAGERMRQTASLLAAALGLKVNLSFDKGQEAALAKALKALPAGTQALVVWEHSRIPAIGKALGKVSPKPPSAYPSDRFDVCWTYTADGKGGWTFAQVLEAALPSDRGYVVSRTAGFIAKVKQTLGIGI
jgi:hypothetical protein